MKKVAFLWVREEMIRGVCKESFLAYLNIPNIIVSSQAWNVRHDIDISYKLIEH